MSEASKTVLLGATRSDLECLMAGYLLFDEPRTIKQLHDTGVEIVGEHMPDLCAVRRYAYQLMNQSPPYVDAANHSFSLNKRGLDLQLLARYRLTHALSHGIPVEGLFVESPDPLGLCKFLAYAESEEGTKTVQELAKASGLSRKQSSRFLHRVVSFGLAERTDVQSGPGRKLALNSNGPLSSYMRGINLMLTYITRPDVKVTRWNITVGGVAAEQLPDRIRMYEAQTGRTWGK